MIFNDQELFIAIKDGESQTVEFKFSQSQSQHRFVDRN
jgi:hypothetical protein